MMQWRERLYAFLLRRLVGPWLEEESSQQQLYQLIDVSLQDGVFVLRDVRLATRKLSSMLNHQHHQPLLITRATVKKLEMHLNLQEHPEEHGREAESSSSAESSLAWRAWKLGSAHQQGAVAVMVKIMIDGIVVDLEPTADFTPRPSAVPKTSSTAEGASATSKGMFASYMEAVVASLRLSMDVRDLKVNLQTPQNSSATPDFVSLCVQDLSYHDVIQSAGGYASGEERNYETIVQKIVDLQRVSVFIGTQNHGGALSSSMMALLDGKSRLRLRVIEYSSREQNPATKDQTTTQIQHDFDVSLGQKLSFLFDSNRIQGLLRIIRLYQAVYAQNSRKSSDDGVQGLAATTVQRRGQSEEDRRQEEEDMQTLNGIMRQYKEARRLAEQNQMKGGMLVADEDDSENMTYDVFFDANDQSIYRYSTVMSHCQAVASTEQDQEEFVYLKGRFLLSAGSFKIVFGTTKMEYLLGTFSDLSANASFAGKSSAVSLTLAHFEIEESSVVPLAVQGRQRTEISRVLHFITNEDTADNATGELLINSPCASVDVKSAALDAMECHLNLEPLQILLQSSTMSNLVQFIQSVSWSSADAYSRTNSVGDDTAMHRTSSASISLFCPSIDILSPLGMEEDLKELFMRSSHIGESSLAPPMSTSAGLHIDSFQAILDKSEDQRTLRITSDHAIAYIASPTKERSISYRYRVFDIVSLSGGHVPLSVDVVFDRTLRPADSNHAVSAFPLAPSIASFKARQDDEDDEQQIDRVLLSTMGEMGIAAKRELRGKDPQTRMLRDCEDCTVSVILCIPHFYLDLTVDECLAIIGSLPSTNIAPSAPSADPNHHSEDIDHISLSFQCEHASIGIHQRNSGESFLLKLKSLRMHSVLDKGSTRHFRLAAQEVDFFGARGLLMQSTAKQPISSESRSSAVFRRSMISNESAVPILHRSHLFKPLSRESPSLLLDVLFHTEDSSHTDRSTPQSIHLTMYDITYRHSSDSTWRDNLKSIMDAFFDTKNAPKADLESSAEASLTRVFLEIADCNVDYSTALRCQNAARLILRFGDVRCSSNVVLPSPVVQACNISMADISLSLCQNRHAYNFENSFVIDSDLLFVNADTSHLFLDPAEAIKSMNYRTMVLLDSVDAIVAVARHDPPKKNVPSIFTSLTVGEVSLYGAKDSFWLLVQTVGELVGETTALTENQINELKNHRQDKDDEEDTFFDSVAVPDAEDSVHQHTYVHTLDHLREQSALRPAVGTKSSHSQRQQFLLDGYDWTTIDQAESSSVPMADDEEQSARWYTPNTSISVATDLSVRAGPGISLTEEISDREEHSVRIIPHHFPIRPDNDPLADGDMGAGRYTGTPNPLVASRILVHDLKVKLRFFDGYDWPDLLPVEALEKDRKGPFLIDLPKCANEDDISDEKESSKETQKSKLLAELLEDQAPGSSTFKHTPLPEEKGARLAYAAKCRRLARRTGKYFQISASGICFRNDSFLLPANHCLSSCLTMKIQDFFIAETISGSKPLKMVGEWFSENEHPRDSRDGLLMMKMIVWAPKHRLTEENEIASDECEAVVKLLPLRCLLDQRAIRFATVFFSADDAKDVLLPQGLTAVPPPKVKLLRFKPFRVKVDYKPEKVNHQALRDGQIVELINFSPLHGMVLILQQVEIDKCPGFGDAISILTKSWIGDICSTQISKFLTNSQPFEPITTIGGGAADMVVLPWEAIRNGESLQRSLRSGAKSFANAIAYEALTISSGIAEYMANQTSGRYSSTQRVLPSRPDDTPRGMADTTHHALESIARGFQEANFKIVIVPYREYQRSGTSGALKSVLKGIPVALAAPTSGISEALSFALLGARNQLRPDIRKEEEVSQRGLRMNYR